MLNINNKESKVKRLSAILLSIVLLFTLVSCGTIDRIIDRLDDMDGDGTTQRPSRSSKDEGDESDTANLPYAKESDFETERYSGGVAVKKYVGSEQIIKIPATVNGETVLAINGGAFADIKTDDGNTIKIEEIIVPDTVVEIKHGAFSGCKSIIRYTAPFIGGEADDHTYLGYVFGAVNPSSNAEYLPDTLEDVTVGGRTVDEKAFQNCDTLKKVVLTEATSVGDRAFEGCSKLRTVIIPDTVTSIGTDVFKKCGSLYELRLPYLGNGTEHLYLGYVFGADNAKNNVNYVPTSLRKLTVNIGDTIPSYAFYECMHLTSVTLVGNPKAVGDYAFYLCKRMRDLDYGDEAFGGIEQIGDHSFAYCDEMTAVKLAADIKTIPAYGFYGCTSLRSIYFGDTENVLPQETSIDVYSFAYCAGLADFTLPDNITIIPQGLFYGCSGLRQVNIPDAVTEIHDEAFKGCSSLTTVLFGKDSKLEKIGSSAFSYCSSLRGEDIDPDEDKASYVFALPNSVKSIGEYAFAYCDYLKNIILPESTTAIPDYCFFGCADLEKIDVGAGENTLGDNVWSVGVSAFNGCQCLEKLTLSTKISSIGDSAFNNCDNLVFTVAKDSYTYNWLIDNGVGNSRLDIKE